MADEVMAVKNMIPVGLAANQIGYGVKVISLLTPEFTGYLVNPYAVWYADGTEIAEEQCLSIPNVSVRVRRARKMRVHFESPIDRSPQGVIFEGFTARVAQHELDHLDGILITDRQVYEESNINDLVTSDKRLGEAARTEN